MEKKEMKEASVQRQQSETSLAVAGPAAGCGGKPRTNGLAAAVAVFGGFSMNPVI